MLNLRKITDVYEMKVFTDKGEYFGEIEEGILTNNKVSGWKVKATRTSVLNKALGGAKGVIIPHQLVKAVGDIMIISRAAIPSPSGEESDEAAMLQQ